eukprot:1707674-Rhodomonas_salina.7
MPVATGRTAQLEAVERPAALSACRACATHAPMLEHVRAERRDARQDKVWCTWEERGSGRRREKSRPRCW